ncbi:A deaminase N domain containing protein [Asbolus verrucosus]|uniref:A deaminase N domain containing protein n=1 Tax=Asbolus verrucosus TaxID=1661398 RepID=A0A482W7Y5_ASBVE|nr:A deaminase N domain containing protein [Asbolus verrucosus]
MESLANLLLLTFLIFGRYSSVDYWSDREIVLAREASELIGSSIDLTEKEQEADIENSEVSKFIKIIRKELRYIPIPVLWYLLIFLFNLIVDDLVATYNDINAVWNKFSQIFSLIAPLLSYRPLLRDYMDKIFQEFCDDNVMHLEIRVDNQTMETFIEQYLALQRLYPEMIADFDLIGQEDVGKPLSDFVD